ncbi:hypothetical protein, partial [Burkholderia cenocepacia]|uniref:hypothetical protein n=1 Tax=Burkholderia cenocepacia TaxID=95486 RepID=UPI001C4E2C20
MVLRGDGDTVVLMMTDVGLAGNMTGVELAHVAKRYRPDLDVIVTSGSRCGSACPTARCSGPSPGRRWT